MAPSRPWRCGRTSTRSPACPPGSGSASGRSTGRRPAPTAPTTGCATRRRPDDATRLQWTFRAADVDVAAHVNNAVYWEALEEGPTIAAACVVEAEHRAPAVAGPAVIVRDGDRTWVTSTQGEVHASFEVSAS